MLYIGTQSIKLPPPPPPPAMPLPLSELLHALNSSALIKYRVQHTASYLAHTLCLGVGAAAAFASRSPSCILLRP
jgi:hypothetical protein